MHRSFTLSPHHYAANWKVQEVEDRHTVEEVNKFAFEFATTENVERKQELQLKLLECFHSYLLKYLNMIIYGQLPLLTSPQGKDARLFLKLLLPKNSSDDLEGLRTTCKTLHLAFKDHVDTDEVYDTLSFIFMRVCAHYDPLYPKKTEEVCNYIADQPTDQIIKIEDISATTDFDPIGCIRILVRGDYLETVQGPKKVTVGYKCSSEWPPPRKYFQVSSMGFVGFVQRFFRWYLRNYILGKRSELENTKDVLQFEHLTSSNDDSSGEGSFGSTDICTPHADGNWVDTKGVRWAADIKLMDRWRSLDVSEMNDDWIRETDDFLFKKLLQEERQLLKLIFVDELSWAEVGTILKCDPETAHNKFKQVMIYLEGRATIHSSIIK